ncbi:response regulator transcription factor [Cryomorpha ignava]|uniref:Response regulator transcription factor n=1 Tax=Cryomorpha ignava TaxID=101383 RepID=A0A7K3WPJ9_9FLAO|nr:LytTR family DNA-binding domain-containing protein [Cryomorpha ignava]NEN22685.1 response regulator transcription factor [Cryomorpha ignava]
MNLLIIEDEEQAAKKLRRILKDLLPNAFMHGALESVEDAVEWIKDNPNPDLIFMDIHLADGLSFEIFTKIEVSSPVIFTTAYDQYALRAFKLNSVDYLLKPIEKEELEKALKKYETHFSKPKWPEGSNQRYITTKTDYENKYKQRFISKIGDKIVAVNTEDIVFAYSENRATYLKNEDGKNFLVDFSLEQLENLLDPEMFFRLNRQYISRFEGIEKMVSYSNSRLKIWLKHCDNADIVLSREKTRLFKEWIDR